MYLCLANEYPSNASIQVGIRGEVDDAYDINRWQMYKGRAMLLVVKV